MGFAPIIIGLVTGGATYIFGKGAETVDAADNISYDVAIKDFKIHKVKLIPPTIESRFTLELKLINPSNSTFAIKSPDIILFHKGENIGHSKPSNSQYTLKPKSEVTIKDLHFSVNLYSLSSEIGSLVLTAWKVGKGLATNISNVNKVLSAKQDQILKDISVKVNITINDMPLTITESLAGYQALGQIMLGYAPTSAKDRIISDGTKYDKYFPLPEGKKEIVVKDASVEQTVKKMIDIVNKDAHLVREASFALFKADTPEKTAQKLFDWIVKYIKYNIEEGEQLRNPLVTFHLGQRLAYSFYKKNGYFHPQYSADCDDISIFIACVLKNLGIPYYFRIASYTDILGNDRGFSHVYAMMPTKNKQAIIIDPVYHSFNAEKSFSRQKTFDMNKNILNGIDVHYLHGIPFRSQNDEAIDVLTGTDLKEDSEQALYSYLVKSRNQLAKNPEAIKNGETILKMYDYALQYWNTKYRETAITILEEAERKLRESGFLPNTQLNGESLQGNFFTNLLNWIKNLGKRKNQTINLVKSNYAVSSAVGTIDGLVWDNVKTFVSKYKVPLAIGTGAIAAGTAYLVSKKWEVRS